MQIFKAVGAVVFALATATGIALDILQITQIDLKWWTLVAFLVSCGFVISIIMNLNNKNRELENKKPFPDITPVTYFDDHLLSVTNNGEKGTFSAQISVLSSNTGNILKDIPAMSVGYTALWSSTKTNESEIKKGHSDSITIANVRISKVATSLDLIGYNVVNKSPYTVLSAAWNPSIKDAIKPEYWLQVNISSDPSLNVKGGSFVRNYVVGLNDIKEPRLQPKPGVAIKLVQVGFGKDDDLED